MSDGFTPSEALTKTQDDIRKQITHTVTQSHGVSRIKIHTMTLSHRMNNKITLSKKQ